MAEYSRLAQGSFLCTAQQQVVYLPFIPDYVKVTGLSGVNHVAGAGTVNSLEWESCMQQGDGITMVQLSSGAPVYSSASPPNGITTFSAGLSFNYGAQKAIASISTANPAVVTTVAAHGYNSGDIVILEGITGMQQMAAIPMQITVTGTMTFTVPWNTNQSSYTLYSGTTPPSGFSKKINYPFLYAPGVSIINAILLSGAATSGTVFPSSPANVPGNQTYISTTTAHNLSVGSEVAFRIPPAWGTVQLNSLPNVVIPGSPLYGYVTSVLSSTQVAVSINSSNFSAYTNNMLTNSVPGLTPPQMLAVGDINNGGIPYSGNALYPSPIVNGVNTINGPAIQGAFVNNTRMGFVIGSSILTPGAVNTSSFVWQAYQHDYLAYSSVGVLVS